MSWFGWSDEWTGDPNELGFSWSGVDRYRTIWMTMRRLMSQTKSNWFRNWKTQLNIPFDMYPTLPK